MIKQLDFKQLVCNQLKCQTIFWFTEKTLSDATSSEHSGPGRDGNSGLVWFYGILTIVSYLMLNPIYSYILDIYGSNSYRDFELSCVSMSIRHMQCKKAILYWQWSVYVTPETGRRFYIYSTLTGTITKSQSGSGSNGNKGVLHIPQSFLNGTSSLDAVWCNTQDPHIWRASYSSTEDEVDVF